MKTIINQFVAQVRRAVVSGMGYSERYHTVVLPAQNGVRNEYQTTSRELLGNALERHLIDGAPFDLTAIAELYIEVECFYEEVNGLTGLSRSAPAFLNFGVRGADGKLTYVDFANAKEVKEMLQGLSDDELGMLLMSLQKAKVDEWFADAEYRLGDLLKNAKFYSFNYEDGLTSEPVFDDLVTAAKKRAVKYPAALNVLSYSAETAMKAAGGFKAVALMVVKHFALKASVGRRVIEQARINAEASYVVHSGGGSYLVESKNGERPGSASGKDTASDIAVMRQEVEDSNYDTMDSIIEGMLEIYAPMAVYIGELPAFMTKDVTIPATNLRVAFEARVKAWDDYFRSLDNKGEGYADKVAAARLECGEKMAAAVAANRDRRIAELLG